MVAPGVGLVAFTFAEENHQMIEIVERMPTAGEYQSIIASVGFRGHTVNAVETALNNTVFCVCAMNREDVVGIGRIVGDGAISFLLTNIIVRPQHQRRGIGTRIVQTLCELMDTLPHRNMVLEVAPLPELEAFYKQCNFTSSRHAAPGMVRWFNKTDSEQVAAPNRLTRPESDSSRD